MYLYCLGLTTYATMITTRLNENLSVDEWETDPVITVQLHTTGPQTVQLLRGEKTCDQL